MLWHIVPMCNKGLLCIPAAVLFIQLKILKDKQHTEKKTALMTCGVKLNCILYLVCKTK